MSRYRGVFNQSSNYEPLIAAPLDARTVVEFKSDLTNPTTWTIASSTPYLFSGLLVCVTNDLDASLNGLYILINADNYTSDDSWRNRRSRDLRGQHFRTESHGQRDSWGRYSQRDQDGLCISGYRIRAERGCWTAGTGRRDKGRCDYMDVRRPYSYIVWGRLRMHAGDKINYNAG